MKIAAILLAGGKSERFGRALSKLHAKLSGKRVLDHSLDTLKQSNLFDEIIVVEGPLAGETRQMSSLNGLLACSQPDFVLIHDGARPLVTVDILKRNIDAVQTHFAVNTCIPTCDTINFVDRGNVSSIPDRSKCYRGQTPQSFAYDLILEAHRKTKTTNSPDDCSLVLELGHKVHVVLGSERNLKITSPIDLAIAEALLYS
jgi:2-C-methyl-D-erythritol 4-phosphate cytidylyltransferase